MANRNNHYEAAFEAWLRRRRVPYIAVDEKKRALMGGGSLKSLDFIVSSSGLAVDAPLPEAPRPDAAVEKNLDTLVSASDSDDEPAFRWLVDVKGRKFPSGDQQVQYWKNWSTRDDLWSLGQWERLFGDRFRGLFVFAYLVLGTRAPLPAELLFNYGGATYGFVAVSLRDYARWARPISTAWDTVAMPSVPFRELARPMASLV